MKKAALIALYVFLVLLALSTVLSLLTGTASQPVNGDEAAGAWIARILMLSLGAFSTYRLIALAVGRSEAPRTFTPGDHR